MADEIQLADNRPFPPPPPFWKSFTNSNTEQLRRLREEVRAKNESDEQPAQDLTASLIPGHLSNLIPPKPPTEGKYRVFTEVQDISSLTRSLESQGVPQLYPSSTHTLPTSSANTNEDLTVDRVYYLRKLIRSLLLAFLELVDALSRDTGAAAAPGPSERLEAIVQLFHNAHKLVNDYRPHQARETLILLMEYRLRKGREEIKQIGRMKDRIEEILAGLAEYKDDTGDEGKIGDEETSSAGKGLELAEAERKRLNTQRNAWRALEEEMVG